MHNAIIKFSNSEPVFYYQATGLAPHPNPLPSGEGMLNYNLTSISTPAGKSNLLNSSVVC